MRRQVNLYEAKSQLSRLVEEVEAGGEIIIARAGRPVARLVPLQRSGHDRTPGSLRGKIWMAPDFDDTDDQLIDLMENGPVFPGDEHDREST